MSRVVFAALVLAAVPTAPAAAQIVDLFPEPTVAYRDLFIEADEFARRGLGRQTELAYDRILILAPRTVPALVGRGLGRSWQGKHALAAEDFRGALAIEPDNVEALVGLGYTYLWDGSHEEAEVTFRRALTLAPADLRARKGVGYAESWGGRPEEALATFAGLRAADPADPDPPAAIGQAHLALGQTRRALDSYRASLALDPVRVDALAGVQQAYGAPAALEFSFLGGNTTRNAAGMAAELAARVTPRTRLWARYDNGLNPDHPALARAGNGIHSFYAGASRDFSAHWRGTGEVGYRTYPDGGGDQNIYKGELAYLSADGVLKLGAQMSPHRHGYSDETGYISYAANVGARWTLEPIAFYSNTSALNDHEWRAAVQAEHRTFRRLGIGFGAAIGGIRSDTPGAGGKVRALNASVQIPFRGFHYLNFSIRREKAPTGNYTAATIGVTLRRPRD